MAVFIVSYDTVKERNYQALYEGMENVGGVRLLESVWGVALENTTAEVRDWVRDLLDDDDKILVVKLKPSVSWAARKCGTDVTAWLREHISK